MHQGICRDKYKLTGTDKLSWVDNALKETTGRTCNKVDVVDDAGAEVQVRERCWSINYTSCTGLSHGGNPFTSARVVNEHLYKSPYINPSGTEDTKSDYLKHIGIIASDFVDAALAGASTSATTITIRSTRSRLRAASRPACA